jgi:hypothetical protein
MSGGRFEYKQYCIGDIVDVIERHLNRQGKERPEDDLWVDEEYLEKYPEERYYETYPEDIQRSFKEGIKFMKLAEVYAQRIDWFLSGDDGEDSFRKRLNEDLKELIEEGL